MALDALKAGSIAKIEATGVQADLLMNKDLWKGFYVVLAESGTLLLNDNAAAEHSDILLSNLKLAGFPASSQISATQIAAQKPKRQAAASLKKPAK